jgi:hypothetical protein
VLLAMPTPCTKGLARPLENLLVLNGLSWLVSRSLNWTVVARVLKRLVLHLQQLSVKGGTVAASSCWSGSLVLHRTVEILGCLGGSRVRDGFWLLPAEMTPDPSILPHLKYQYLLQQEGLRVLNYLDLSKD